MDIIPPFILSLIYLYFEPLQAWLSQHLYSLLIERLADDFLVRLHARLDFAFLEAACAAYHHAQGAGAKPTYPVSQLGRALVVKYVFKCSLRQLESTLRANLLAKWFVGLPLFAPVPDHSTLARFEQWVEQHQHRTFFDEVLRQIDQHLPDERQLSQVGDTFGMHADAAEEGLVKRLRRLCLKLLEAYQKVQPHTLGRLVSGLDWVALFGPPREKYTDLIDAAYRQRRLQNTVLAALDLKQRLQQALANESRSTYPHVRCWLGYLDKVLADEVRLDLDEHGLPAAVLELPTKEKGDFRLISASDPEATYRQHGEEPEDVILGYNIQVAATTSGFVREIQAYTGAASDSSGVAALISAQVEHHNCCPPQLIYDTAAGNGKTRTAVAQASQGLTQLVSPLPNLEKRTARFGPYDFTLSADGLTLTCPNEKLSTIAYASQSGDGRTFRFLPCQCWPGAPTRSGRPPKDAPPPDLAQRCPLWEQCRDASQSPRSMRQVFISDYRDSVLQARQFNLSPQFEQDYKQRSAIERVIFELTNYNDARRCHAQGQERADFQAKMCAMAYNLKLWLRRLVARRVAAAQPQA
jgi:hypothetical protein